MSTASVLLHCRLHRHVTHPKGLGQGTGTGARTQGVKHRDSSATILQHASSLRALSYHRAGLLNLSAQQAAPPFARSTPSAERHCLPSPAAMREHREGHKGKRAAAGKSSEWEEGVQIKKMQDWVLLVLHVLLKPTYLLDCLELRHAQPVAQHTPQLAVPGTLSPRVVPEPTQVHNPHIDKPQTSPHCATPLTCLAAWNWGTCDKWYSIRPS